MSETPAIKMEPWDLLREIRKVEAEIKEFDEKAAVPDREFSDFSNTAEGELDQRVRRVWLLHLEGILLAKEKGLKPPFDVKDKVKSVRGTVAVNCHYIPRTIGEGEYHWIRDITYTEENGWVMWISTQSMFEYYKCSDFEKV